MPWPFQFNRYKPGDPLRKIRADDLQCVFNILNTIEGVGCSIQKTRNGIGWKIVTANALGPNGGAIRGAFDIEKINGDWITLHRGFVEWHRDTGPIYTEPNNYDALEMSGGYNYIYIEFTPNMSAGTASAALKCEKAGSTQIGSFPAAWGINSDATHYRKILYEVQRDISYGEELSIKITRFHFGNVEFVGWRGY